MQTNHKKVPILRRIIGPIFRMMLERPAAKMSYTGAIDALVDSSVAIDQRAAQAKDSAANRKQLRHVTTIERWGQARLRVFLGDPFVPDECDEYAPAAELDMAGQREAFRTTRAETIALARQIQAADLPPSAKVVHNDAGPLSAKAWLRYLRAHADWESKKMR
jgi:hypothetical protein